MTIISATFPLPIGDPGDSDEEFSENSIVSNRHLDRLAMPAQWWPKLIHLPALRAQNYIHDLISENANVSMSLVAGIGR